MPALLPEFGFPHRWFYSLALTGISTIFYFLLIVNFFFFGSEADRFWIVAFVLLHAAFTWFSGFSFTGKKRPATVPFVLMTFGAPLILGISTAVTLGYSNVMTPGAAMALATASWYTAISAALAISIPIALDTPISREKAVAAALAALFAAFPFVADGVSEASSPRPIAFSAIDKCDSANMAVDTAMQYVFAPTDNDPPAELWKEAKVIAIVHGQALAPLEWPAMMGEDMHLHRRYLLHQIPAANSAPTELNDERRNAVMSALTLGRSHPTGWDGIVTIDYPCTPDTQ